MRLLYFTLLFSLFYNCVSAQKETDKAQPCMPIKEVSEEARSYRDGEILAYKIRYIWGMIKSDVGEATTQVTRHNDSKFGDYYHAVVRGRTYRFYDLLFKVRDLFESKFNTYNGRPYYFHRDILEGKYTMKNTFFFNKDYSIQANVQRKSDPVIDTILQGRECTFDLVSLFYFARNLDFSETPVGVNQPLSFAIDNEIFNVYYRYEGREVKKIYGLGTFNTLKFAVKVVAGEVFSGKDEIVLWVTDDENKVPLYFETPIKVGSVTGRLYSFENLKFPLKSKIK